MKSQWKWRLQKALFHFSSWRWMILNLYVAFLSYIIQKCGTNSVIARNVRGVFFVVLWNR